MLEAEVIEAVELPSDAEEYAAVGPDDAPADGQGASPGLPWDSAARADVEPGLTQRARVAMPGVGALATEAIEHITIAGLRLIEGFEGFSAKRYLDPVGIPTIGYGTTSADVFPLPATCSRGQAEGWLRSMMARKYEPAVRGVGVALNAHQFDALCSFVYNLGPGAVGPSWTIGRLLRQRNYVGAADSLLMYDHAGGAVLAGLARRRAAERSLFLSPVVPDDPHHLALFPTNTWLIAGQRVPEQGTVARWWQLIGDRAAHVRELRVLQGLVVLLRKRVWALAHRDRPASWGVAHRGARWQELEAISKVKL